MSLTSPLKATDSDVSRFFKEALPETRHIVAATNSKLKRTFSGSNDVGGADADLILDGCLIDFKSTINAKLTSTWLYQLLGYALLDYRDEHQITRVGIYFSRQGVLLQWDLADLIRELSAGPPMSVDQMRTQLSSLLSGGSSDSHQFRKAVGVAVRQKMEEIGWRKDGERKGYVTHSTFFTTSQLYVRDA